jgi:hypothetical protein
MSSQPSRDDGRATDTTADADANTSPDSPGNDTLDEYLPDAGVDSRWWYWIAAVPVYALLSTLIGFAAFVGVFLLGLAGDAVGFGFLAFFLLFVLIALPGLVLTVLFPIATYVDAKAVAEADVGWDPDPALYGLVALAGVLLTGFTVSLVLAVYYLYQRHKYVGTP